jgi:hypothetical protein
MEKHGWCLSPSVFHILYHVYFPVQSEHAEVRFKHRRSFLRKTCAHERNIGARSRNHCCRGKAISITYRMISSGLSSDVRSSNASGSSRTKSHFLNRSRTSYLLAYEDGTDTVFRNVGI